MTDTQLAINTISEPDDILELRLIRGKSPNAQIEKLWIFAKELPAIEKELQELNADGFNIYFGPNPRNEFGKSGDSNVLLARCLFCDFDDADPKIYTPRLEEIANTLKSFPNPSIMVDSGHGIHLYWRLAEPIYDLSIWTDIQNRLNKQLGADQTIKNPERIMRLPGFLNTKREPFVPCRILGGN